MIKLKYCNGSASNACSKVEICIINKNRYVIEGYRNVRVDSTSSLGVRLDGDD